MDNCVQTSSGVDDGCGRHGAGGGGEGGRLEQMQRRRGKEAATMEGHRVSPPPSAVKVRMVLTKRELGWLVARLRNGDRRLEDVLHEMAARNKKREGRADGWRPGLESIVECPAETAAGSDGWSD